MLLLLLFSNVQLFGTPWTIAHQTSLPFVISWSLLKFMSIESVTPSNHLVPCHPLLLLHSIFPASGSFPMSRLFFIRWPMNWKLSFSIGPSNEYSGLISFRIGWLDLLAVQGTQESSPTPQYKSINSLAFSLLYGPALTSIHDTGKTTALTT